MTCEHDDYEMVGSFPENMEVDGELLYNDIICNECGKVGKEYYEFAGREWTE